MENQNYYNEITSKLLDYKIVYTSEPKKVIYTNTINPPNYSSTFIINNLQSILEYICVEPNDLYVVILISNEKIEPDLLQSMSPNICLCDLTLNCNEELESKIFGYKMKVSQANYSLGNLVGQIYEFNSNSSDIVLFVQTNKIFSNFINWIKWSFIGFESQEHHVDLIYNSNPDLYAQFICLKNYISDITIDSFTNIKIKFLHSINYLNLIPKKEIDELNELVSSTNLIFNIYQNNIVNLQLEKSNPLDNLFLRSFSSTPNHMTTRQSKTYVSNRIKLIKSKTEQSKPTSLLHLELNEFFIKSLDQIVSLISLSNWYDEYLSESCLGLLVKIESEFSDRMGWSSETIKVKVTNTLIGRDQIYDGHEFFWKKNARLDNGKLLDSLISGSVIGSGNSMIPLYINEYHWIYSSRYTEELISTGITQNPYLFKPVMYGLYAHVLLELISKVIITDPTYMDIRMICWIVQTIKKLNLDSLWNQTDIQTVNDIRVWLVGKFLQWLDQDLDNIFNAKFIFNTYQEITRRNMRKEFKTKKDIKNLGYIEVLNKSINKENIQEFENLCIFVRLIKPNQIKELIDSTTQTFGWIGDDSIEPIKNTIKINDKFFNLTNMFNSIQPNIDPETISKLFTYQNFLCRIPKLKCKLEQTIGVFDLTDQISIESISKYFDSINQLLN